MVCCVHALIFKEQGGKSLPVTRLRPLKLTLEKYVYTNSSRRLDLVLPL